MQNSGRPSNPSPRSAPASSALFSASSQAQNHRRNNTPAHALTPAAARQRFLHAAFRFELDPRGDYTVFFSDPDLDFNWQDIMTVIIPPPLVSTQNQGDDDLQANSDREICPICYSKLVAPRITRCGHVFCLSCILHIHHMSRDPSSNASETTTSPCPVCHDGVNPFHLKQVKFLPITMTSPDASDLTFSSVDPALDFNSRVDEGLPHTSPEYSSSMAESDSIDIPSPLETSQLSSKSTNIIALSLLRRPPRSMIALPAATSNFESQSIAVPPFSIESGVGNRARFSLASPPDIIQRLNYELEVITQELKLLRSDIEACRFLRSAEVRIQASKEWVSNSVFSPRVMQSYSRACRAPQENKPSLSEVEVSNVSCPGSESSHLEPSVSPTTSTHRHNRPKRNVNPPLLLDHDQDVIFYGASNGANVFLHPIDMRILTALSQDGLPNSITLRVDHQEEHTITSDLRKRYRFLAHLPLSALFSFVEVDWHGADPSKLGPFEQALKLRRSKRLQKTKKEDKARALADANREAQRQVDSAPRELTEDMEMQAAIQASLREDAPALPQLLSPSTLASRSRGTQSNSGARSQSATPWGSFGAPRVIHSEGSAPVDPDLDAAWNDFASRKTEPPETTTNDTSGLARSQNRSKKRAKGRPLLLSGR